MITEYMDNCLFCRRQKQDTHHLCFGTANRRISDKDDLTIPVCREHHDLLHKHDKISKVIGQLAYERDRCAEGYSLLEARKMFMEFYGKNYL